ncbi:MAG: hypothetical protein LW834_08095 [Cyanobium sp. 49614_E6]|jgi:hypothetical protein|nr:hypothetical protein [Cyanobium sp. 49614_E6]
MIDVVMLARQAGVCFPDCHFLDVDPYEDLLEMTSRCRTEQEREDYLALVKAEERRRQEKLHALEAFAAAVLQHGAEQLAAAAGDWQSSHCSEVAVGGLKAARRLELLAVELQERTAVEIS